MLEFILWNFKCLDVHTKVHKNKQHQGNIFQNAKGEEIQQLGITESREGKTF